MLPSRVSKVIATLVHIVSPASFRALVRSRIVLASVSGDGFPHSSRIICNVFFVPVLLPGACLSLWMFSGLYCFVVVIV